MIAERRDWLIGVLAVALLLLGFAIKGALIEPPSPPTHAVPGEFDTDRAISRLQRVLGDQRPHPVDTAADDAVRGRLIAELHAIGLNPEVHEALDCSDFPKTRVVSCSRVRNVIATVPGRASGPHLLLNAHYDSTPTGPGAGDDGLGVATLLEVGSSLKAAPPLHPVTLLFNEGEEFGLNGSSAFVRHDPLARQIDQLINIDARGVTGPALMFETSEPNGEAIAIYRQGARRPYANSLSTDFARLIPNTTDVVEFKPAHWTILNFGIIGNESRYHSPGDTVAALDPASLYHVGSEVLALTRGIADGHKTLPASNSRSVFTDIAGRAFISLPLAIAALLLALLVVAAVALAWREKGLGRPLLLAFGTVLAGIVASSFVALIATLARPGDFWRAYPLVTYLGVYAVLIAAMTAAWSRWGWLVERRRMRAAVWLLVLVVGTALSLALPGAIIFFLIAPAIALLAIAVERRARRTAGVLATAAAILQFVMFAELLALIEMLLVDGPLWAVTPVAALAVIPFLAELRCSSWRPAVAVILVAAGVVWITAMVLPRSSAERPASFSIDYFRDADHKTASWGIAAKQAPLPSSYGAQWHQGELPYNGRTRWIADAPLLDTPVASARVVGSQAAGFGRRLRLLLSSGGGDALTLRFAKGTKLIALGLAGAPELLPVNGPPEKALLRCTGRACEGLVVEADLADRRPIDAELFSYKFALPREGLSLQARRPRNAIPQYAPDSAITMTRVRL